MASRMMEDDVLYRADRMEFIQSMFTALTPSQLGVYILMVQGFTIAQIAETKDVSRQAVDFQVQAIKQAAERIRAGAFCPPPMTPQRPQRKMQRVLDYLRSTPGAMKKDSSALADQLKVSVGTVRSAKRQVGGGGAAK